MAEAESLSLTFRPWFDTREPALIFALRAIPFQPLLYSATELTWLVVLPPLAVLVVNGNAVEEEDLPVTVEAGDMLTLYPGAEA